MCNRGVNRRAQVTIFIIIAILIVASVVLYFILRKPITKIEAYPSEIQAVETTFLTCLEDYTLTGVDILESQGGYIYLPEFVSGSEYMPFSSQLDFLGTPIPYWYYVSGNNIEKEQVPTKELMQEQLAVFIEQKINDCNLRTYTESGYVITKGTPKANVSIQEDQINIDLNMDLGIDYNAQTAIISDHKKIVSSSLGKLYNSAKKVYDYEQQTLFLENYSIDNLRLYAPVDGVEISCAPLNWNADSVFSDLDDAIELNTLALKSSGKNTDYFVVKNLPVSENVRFINSKNWPRVFEVNPSEENLLLATPVGNQEGLGVLGFCYVPYHFVYNLRYSTLIQVSDGVETFQFPVAVLIEGNKQRKPLEEEAVADQSIGLCNNKNNPISVSVYDLDLKPISAEIYYECFGEQCRIGNGSSIKENFPQCVNGYIIAKAKGFKEERKMFSSTGESSLSLYLNKIYTLPLNLAVDNKNFNENALIIFSSEDFSRTIIYPSQKSIDLVEGDYNVTVYIYKNSSLNLTGGTKEQCIDVSGLFGITTKKCFNIEIPSQLVTSVLAGGGQKEIYLFESNLANAKSLSINVESLPVPSTIEQIQDNYALFEGKGVEIEFK